MTRGDEQESTAATERLRVAFAARRVSLADDVCPESAELFDAGHGQLPVERMNAVIDHVTRCAECAEAWRLLLAIDGLALKSVHAAGAPREQGGSVVALKRASLFSHRFLAPLAAAAGVVLAIGLLVTYLPHSPPDAPQYRANAAADVPKSLVGTELPRSKLLLRWSGSATDASYTLRVMTTSLEPILIKEGLRQTEYLVPASALAGMAADGELLWQVEALLPGGRRETSQSYVLKVR